MVIALISLRPKLADVRRGVWRLSRQIRYSLRQQLVHEESWCLLVPPSPLKQTWQE